MAYVRVRCVRHDSSASDTAGITHIGGIGWKWTTHQVIDSIKKNTNTFYIVISEEQYNLNVVQKDGGEQLVTSINGENRDLLTLLPECVD